MSSIKVIETRKKQKLLIDGHFFIKFKETGDTTSWCCDKKGILKCSSIVTTCLVDGSYDIKDGPTEHNHVDPKKRKLIVATPRKSIVAKRSRISAQLTPIKLDFEENSKTIRGKEADDADTTSEGVTKKTKTVIPYVDQPIELNFGIQEIKFVNWNENKTEKLFIDGFYYTLASKNKTTCHWRCVNSTNKCNVRVVTVFACGAHKLKGFHNLASHNHDKSDIPKQLRSHILSLENGPSLPTKKRKMESVEAAKYEGGQNKKGGCAIPYVDQPIEPNFGVQDIKFIKWEETRLEKLFIDGFYYSLSNLNKDSCRWECTSYRAYKCTGAVTTTFASGAHKLIRPPNVQHGHGKSGYMKSLHAYISNLECENEKPKNGKKRNAGEEASLSDTSDIEEVNEQPDMGDVSMHTQLLSRIPQKDMDDFQPPMDSEVEFVILFGLRRQMSPLEIFYELQSVYGLDAPSFDTVSKCCKRFRAGFYPRNEAESQEWMGDVQLVSVKSEIFANPDISKECISVEPDV